MGAGLVRILTVRANVPILQNLLPEAILTPYDPEQAQTDPAGFKSLVEQECGWASAIVLGPGLGKEAHVASLVQNVLLSAYVPIIVGCGWIKCCRTASAFVRVFYGKCDRYSTSGGDGASDGTLD